jgi:hypothetical protein
MKVRVLLVAVAAVGGLVVPAAGVAAAVPAAASDPGVSVDLSHGWGAYQACILLKPGPATCFTTAAAMNAWSAAMAKGSTAVATASWSCPVSLFSGANYTGRALAIYAQGFWLNLSDYGFDNATVSFVGNACGFHLADGYWGGGYWYPGYTGPWAYCPNMGSAWNYRISSIYIV